MSKYVHPCVPMGSGLAEIRKTIGKSQFLFAIFCLLLCIPGYTQNSDKCKSLPAAKVLIIQDELQQMEVLSNFLTSKQVSESMIVQNMKKP
jgi:hypothetical protein